MDLETLCTGVKTLQVISRKWHLWTTPLKDSQEEVASFNLVVLRFVLCHRRELLPAIPSNDRADRGPLHIPGGWHNCSRG